MTYYIYGDTIADTEEDEAHYALYRLGPDGWYFYDHAGHYVRGGNGFRYWVSGDLTSISGAEAKRIEAIMRADSAMHKADPTFKHNRPSEPDRVLAYLAARKSGDGR